MLRRILQPKYIFPLLLILLSVFVAYLNYTPDTWQTGWDTLHPEFNFDLNIERHAEGMWQEHQGLGAPAAQSHAADLPHILILKAMSTVLPAPALRYAYTFLMLIMGPLGVYYFVKYLVKKKEPEYAEVTGFVAGMFYLLNLGTMQQFYVQQELFTTLYGYIGFLFLFATKYITEKRARYLTIFGVLTLLSTPMAHTPTLFFSYFAVLLVYLAVLCLSLPKRRGNIGRAGMIIAAIIIINSFWLVGAAYYSANYSSSLQDSKFDRFLTGIAHESNQKYGDAVDVFTLKGFFFDWIISKQGQNTYLMQEWIAHTNQPTIQILQISILAVMLLGLFYALRKFPRYAGGLIAVLGASAFFLINSNQPSGGIYDWLVGLIPSLEGILRFPYTKFSIQFTFAYSILVAFGILLLIKLLYRTVKSQALSAVLMTATLALVSVLVTLPIFQGYLISPLVKVKIPDYYFQVFNYFNQQKSNGRIATFPVHNYAGWVEYDWGYQGSGFIWFGIKQPVMDRDFDRWYPANEDYYAEIQTAVYSGDVAEFDRIIDRYKLAFVMLDSSIFASDPQQLAIGQIESLISQSQLIDQASKVVMGSVTIYQTTHAQIEFPELTQTNSADIDAQRLFALTRTSREQEHLAYTQQTDGIELEFTAGIPQNTLLKIPQLNSEDYVTWEAELKATDGNLQIDVQTLAPKLTIDGTSFPLYSYGYSLATNVPANVPLTLVVNDTQRFEYVPGAETKWQFIAKANAAHKFDIFAGATQNLEVAAQAGHILYAISPCQPGEIQPDLSQLGPAEVLPLTSSTSDTCLNFFPNAISATPQLVEMQFGTSTLYPSLLDTCIRQAGDCLNRPMFTFRDYLENDNSTWAMTAAGNPPSMTIIFNAPPIGHVDAEISNVQLLNHEFLAELTATPQIDNTAKNLDVSESDLISLFIPYFQPLADQDVYKQNVFSFQREDYLHEKIQDIIELESANTQDIIGWNIVNYPANLSAFILADNINLSGQTPQIYVGDINFGINIVNEKLFMDNSHNLFNKPPVVNLAPKSDVSAKEQLAISLVNSSNSPSITATNLVEKIAVLPYPYELIRNISLVPKSTATAEVVKVDETVSGYKLELQNTPGNLNLYTSYDAGWVSTCAGQKSKLQVHTLNWFNTFTPECNSLTLIYVPQHYQYIGYILIAAWFATRVMVHSRSSLRNLARKLV